MTLPRQIVDEALPRGLGWLAPALAPVLRRWAQRWIAAGQGCDSSLEVTAGPLVDESEGQSNA